MMAQISPPWARPVSPPSPRVALEVGSRRDPVANLGVVGEVRLRPACIGDMRAIEPLIRDFAEHNLMLPKSFDQLARNFREFVVAVDEQGQVLGCGALRIYTEELAEICSLAVARPLQGAGIGGQLVRRLIEEAAGLGLVTVFALTLRPEFFGRLGFVETPKEEFPLKVWADCRSCPKLHACDEVAMARPVVIEE